MSVWESAEALRDFVYKSGHNGPLRDRLKWFEKPSAPHLTLWWIPAGHIPSVEEARDRLEFLKTWGESLLAFSIRNPYPRPEEPLAEAAPLELNFDQREFASASKTPNGDSSRETNFHYRQRGDRLWAMYGGGNVRFGSLVAVGDRHGRLDMRYQHADATGRLRTGRSRATVEVLPDGRLRLHEQWQWTNGDLSEGSSVVEEIAAFKRT